MPFLFEKNIIYYNHEDNIMKKIILFVYALCLTVIWIIKLFYSSVFINLTTDILFVIAPLIMISRKDKQNKFYYFFCGILFMQFVLNLFKTISIIFR